MGSLLKLAQPTVNITAFPYLSRSIRTGQVHILDRVKQCCETVMIYCGSGSYFGKVLVPFPVPVPDLDLFGTVFKNSTKSCLFNARSSIVRWHLIFDFLTYVLHFMLDLGPNPVPGPKPECITIPVSIPLRQKVAVYAVPAPIPQHYS
jgi:hypothetical protein